MSNTSEILFKYLRDIFYNSSGAVLDIDKLDKEFITLGEGLIYFAQCFSQYNELAQALARGDLKIPLPPPENELAAPLKSLHASLKHLTWQSQQVAMGDYSQRVDFMGEFSDAFNKMVIQLAERQKKLEEEIESTRKKSVALEQNNQFLTKITQYISQQIIVIDRDSHEILFINDAVKNEISGDTEYIKKLTNKIFDSKDYHIKKNIEIQYNHIGNERYFLINSYMLEWNNSNAEALVISDVSIEKNKIKELEIYAYRDTMTRLYNRFYGMLTLKKWIEEKRQFALVFTDLDNLKYLNDKYGHNEGDIYIITAAKYLKLICPDSVICRLGGDEFMLLIPNINENSAHKRMNQICNDLQNDEYLADKEYFYSISYGIVIVEKDNELTPSDVLSIADERMYEYKRNKKKIKQTKLDY